MEKFKYQECWSFLEEQNFSMLCTVEKLVDEFILNKEVYIHTSTDLEKELKNCKTYYNDGTVEDTYSEEEIKDMCTQFCKRRDAMKKEWEYMQKQDKEISATKLLSHSKIFSNDK